MPKARGPIIVGVLGLGMIVVVLVWQIAFAPSNQSAKDCFHVGRAYFKAGEYDRAITQFTQAIRLDPKYAEAHYYRGRAYERKRDYDQAIRDYTEAIIARLDADIPCFMFS